MKRIIYIAVIMLCITVFMAGCSGGTESYGGKVLPDSQEITSDDSKTDAEGTNINASGTIIEPEQLISRQEAEELLGEAVSEGEKTFMESIGQKMIYYDSEAEGSFAALQISLIQPAAVPKGSTITPEETYRGAKAGLDETSDVSVSGIGDDCFTGTPGLHILSNGCYIVISAGNSDDQQVQEIWKKAGALAIANLEELM